MRIALLEDDNELARALQSWLSEAGYIVTRYADGDVLLRDQRRETFDLYLLDWMVPGATGDHVLASLRNDLHVTAPVLFVTARDAEDDVAGVLDAGADDFLVKPVRRRELIARIEAVARRLCPPAHSAALEVGPFRIDVAARTAFVHGTPVDLSEKEFDLAAFLFARVDSLVAKRHVARAVWGHNDTIQSRTVDMHVSKLRRKLALGPERGVRLATIYGFGYRLERTFANEFP